MSRAWKVAFGGVVGLLVLAMLALGVTIWWAKTVVSTADTKLWLERENVKTLKASAETTRKALDQKTVEVKSLKDECEQLRMQHDAER